jgi:hypothetical protein
VTQAKHLTLGRPPVAGIPSTEAAEIVRASNQSSLDGFRLGVGIAGFLVIAGGAIGGLGIRNPRRVVNAADCRGGQLAGAPLDAAGLHATGTA